MYKRQLFAFEVNAKKKKTPFCLLLHSAITAYYVYVKAKSGCSNNGR